MDIDLWVIVITALSVLGVYLLLQEWVVSVETAINDHVLLRLWISAAFQFGLSGLGISIVSIMRKESFFSHGLRAKGMIRSICLCSLCFVPHIIFLLLSRGTDGYLPFQSVWTTKELLASGFPVNVIGMAITAVVWGFFEGFNYVVSCDKINHRYPNHNRWLDWGTISCAVLCVLIHSTGSMLELFSIETLSMMVIIYGMLMVKKCLGLHIYFPFCGTPFSV